MTESKICTCPSGDGSLRWPCPKHPAVEQAGGDERAADAKPCATRCPDCGEHDLMPGDLCACGYETDPAAGCACPECDGSGDGCVGEVCRECDGSGWFERPEQARAALAQPSPALAEAERPEVVGYRSKESGMVYEQDYGLKNPEALTTVAECERIVGALRADRDSWAEQAEQRLADWDEMRKERDAALVRVEQQERTIAGMNEAHATLAGLYEAAQAQHSVPGDIMRDAQRYRWLRDQQFYFSFSTENSDAGISSCTAGMSSRFKNLSWVDAAIDSAIAAAPGKEGV
ncbi:TPA: hypothetical protein ACMFRC_001031 [Pseudomonas aeruginosa]|nr:hypothetical protein [Pseudomonas aeruginosa]